MDNMDRIGIVVVLGLILIGGLVLAKSGNAPFEIRQKMEVGPSQGKAYVEIPSHAVEVSPNVFFLGTHVQNGMLLEGYAIIDYKEGYGKPTGCNHDGKCQGWEDASCNDCVGNLPVSDCYGFLSKGAKWKTIESYILNPANARGLDESFVESNFAADVQKWEDATGKDVVGVGSTTNEDLSADMNLPDGRNEIYFGEISGSNAIAVTVVWGIFRGPIGKRELVEWDMVFDHADFDWSASGEAGKMDFENIATHELGHTIGLGDLYESKCSEVTMYGYADYGETKKQTLEAGDIAGAQTLYR